MGGSGSQSAAVALIAAMITPALLLLASASLVAAALVRMARVVDRARALAAIVNEGNWDRPGFGAAQLQDWLRSHALRARCAERSIMLFYIAIVVFVATCLSIGLNRLAGDSLGWLPVALAVAGTMLLLAGGAYMVAESRLSGAQIAAEIDQALQRLQASAARSGAP